MRTFSRWFVSGGECLWCDRVRVTTMTCVRHSSGTQGQHYRWLHELRRRQRGLRAFARIRGAITSAVPDVSVETTGHLPGPSTRERCPW